MPTGSRCRRGHEHCVPGDAWHKAGAPQWQITVAPGNFLTQTDWARGEESEARRSTSWNPFGQDQKEGLPLRSLSMKDPDASGFGLGSFQEHGVSPRGLTLLLETVPGDTADRSHQISSTMNAPAAPIPDSGG